MVNFDINVSHFVTAQAVLANPKTSIGSVPVTLIVQMDQMNTPLFAQTIVLTSNILKNSLENKTKIKCIDTYFIVILYFCVWSWYSTINQYLHLLSQEHAFSFWKDFNILMHVMAPLLDHYSAY